MGFWSFTSSSAEINIRTQHCVLEHHSMKYKGQCTIPEWDSTYVFWAPKVSRNLYKCLLQEHLFKMPGPWKIQILLMSHWWSLSHMILLHRAVIQQLSPQGQTYLSEPGACGKKPVQETQKKSRCSVQLMLLLQDLAPCFYSRVNMNQKFHLLGSSSDQGCPGRATASVRL